MKQLFHLKSRNLNETNLTSSKPKTLAERISKKGSGEKHPCYVWTFHEKRIRFDILIQPLEPLQCTRRVLG